MSNALAREHSLYLRQHADNPVNWMPWGPEAFAEAKRLNKPVLVSVGYSSCHWCHVMARESFEDTYTAGLMNEHFVCIKVDREERPDVDKLMMDAVQMIAGRGGWPLNAFCLPDGRPFFGGTYFPPKDIGRGIIPWPQLIMRVSDFYKKSRAELEENADSIVKNLAYMNTPEGATGAPLGNLALIDAAKSICALHDDTWGGFGDAPKFPSPMSLRFLLAVRATDACESQPALATRIDKVVTHTMRAMACGGIFDQVGGGFSRYSVDAKWAIPHFEKMLYDNGQLLGVYAEAWLRYRDPLFKAVCEETVAWLNREMALPGGAYAAALDADTDHHEGATYVWTPAQIREVLGETDAKKFCAAYGVDETGNFEHGTTNPVFAAGEFSIRESLLPLREKLLAARNQRAQPGRDDKASVSWNALALGGLAEAGWALGRKDWVRRAIGVSDFIAQHLQGADGSLHAVYYPTGGAKHEGTLHDYAWLAEAELTLAAVAEWAEPGRHAVHRARAEKLVALTFEKFGDTHGIGFHLSAENTADPLVTRQKEWWDNATPSGNSALTQVFGALRALGAQASPPAAGARASSPAPVAETLPNASKLAPYDARATDFAAELTELRKAYVGPVTRAPHGVAHALSGFTRDALGAAVIKAGPGADLDALQSALTAPGKPWRRVYVIRDDSLASGTFQTCVGETCLLPVDSASKAAEPV